MVFVCFVGFGFCWLCGFLGLRCIRVVSVLAVFGWVVLPCVVCFSCRLGLDALGCGRMWVGVIQVFGFVFWMLVFRHGACVLDLVGMISDSEVWFMIC